MQCGLEVGCREMIIRDTTKIDAVPLWMGSGLEWNKAGYSLYSYGRMHSCLCFEPMQLLLMFWALHGAAIVVVSGAALKQPLLMFGGGA